MIDPQLDARLRELGRTIPVCRTLGLEIQELALGRCSLRAPRMQAYDGLHPTFHGGLLTTVADCAAWFAISTRAGLQSIFTTSDIHIRFQAPCWSSVQAVARVRKLGRTLAPVQVDLFDDQGGEVGCAVVTYFRREGEPRPAASLESGSGLDRNR